MRFTGGELVSCAGVDEVRAGTLGAREALAALDELERSGSPYAPAWTLAGFSIASLAARRMTSGTGKSGCPIDRLMGFLSFAPSSKIRRMNTASSGSGSMIVFFVPSSAVTFTLR